MSVSISQLILQAEAAMEPLGHAPSTRMQYWWAWSQFARFCSRDAAYEKRSIAVSSNLHPAGFDELMPKTLATATVDRLLHHAHVCQTSGDSIRLAQALAGKGVTAMS